MHCRCVIVAMCVLANAATHAWAQAPAAPEVAFTIQGLLSVQPVDDTYVGSPYLDKGLGGMGPAFAAGVEASVRRCVFAFEFSRTAIEVTQTGRLVSGTATGQLQDSLFSFLAGASVWSSPNGSLVALAGLSAVAGEPSQDEIPIDAQNDPAAQEGNRSIAFTGGLSLARSFGGRLGLIASAKYSALPRSRRAEELGVGTHLFRVGVGLRIRLTK
jgi:hypothetical protein